MVNVKKVYPVVASSYEFVISRIVVYDVTELHHTADKNGKRNVVVSKLGRFADEKAASRVVKALVANVAQKAVKPVKPKKAGKTAKTAKTASIKYTVRNPDS